MSPFAAIVDRGGEVLEGRIIDRIERALQRLGSHPGRRVEIVSERCWAFARSRPEDGSRRSQAPPGSLGFCAGAENLRARGIEEAGGTLQQVGKSRAPTPGEELASRLARFGASAWADLEGSYGVALLEPGGRVLHLARDPLGERTVFFSEAGSQILLADRIETLLALGAGTRSLDRSQLVRFFGLEPPRPGRTYFDGIEEVEPGTAIRFTPEGRESTRFWTPEPDQLRPARSDAEFVEEFRVRLETATERLSGAPDRTGIMLSGGLDSTSIAVVAARQAAKRGARVAACSWLFDELGSCDERRAIELTLAQDDFEVIQVSGDGCWPFADLELFSNLPGTPEENPFRALKSSLYSAACQRGRTLLLNGGTAEIFFRGGSLYFRDLLRDRRWRAAWSGLARQVRESGWRSAAGSAARVLRPTGRRRAERPAPAWLTEPAREWWFEEMARSPTVHRGVRDVVPYLAMESRGLAIENSYARQQGVRVASPYWTRGWLDFMLTLPAHQVYRPGVTKFVAREAMRGRIPEAIRTQQDPTLLDPLFDRGIFEREGKVVEALLDGRGSVWREFVEPSWIQDLGTTSSSARKLVLWTCASFELWRRKHGWEMG